MFFIEVICQVFKHFWIFLLDGAENIGFDAKKKWFETIDEICSTHLLVDSH